MKVSQTLQIGFFFLAAGLTGFSQSIKEADVYSAANRWAEKNTRLTKQVSPFFQKSSRVRQVEMRQFLGSPLPFYVVHLDPEGFIVMNSDKRLPPVLAFSDRGSLDLDDSPRNAFVALLKNSLERGQQKMLRMAPAGLSLEETFLSPEAQNSADWNQLLSSGAVISLGGQQALLSDTNGPFLSTSWNQNNPYNARCPAGGSLIGYDGRVPVGCVAAAGAQLMNYYEWPYRGTGSHSYTDSAGSITGFHSADFSDTYDWANTQDSYSWWSAEPQAAVDAVSELMYELGVAIDMNYESAGSSAYTGGLITALDVWFFYEKGVYTFYDYNSQVIADQLRPEMLASRPAIVSIPGHAVVADGYTTQVSAEYFHINYGWGGVNDGWYLLNDIKSYPALDCITGLYPKLIPINKTPSGSTNVTSSVGLEWVLPAVRAPQVTSLAVLQRFLRTTNFTDSATNFSRFAITTISDNQYWTITNTGYSGGCFFIPAPAGGDQGYHLTSIEKFVPSNGTILSFQLKALLYNDIFRVMISADDGQSWSNKYSLTSQASLSWHLINVDLSSYAGSNVLIRFEYFPGMYYEGAGVWLDEIQVTGGSWYDWKTLQTVTNVAAGSTTLPNMPNGVYTFAFQASTNGSTWGSRSSSFDVTVNAPAGNDADSDGIPDSWETLYFGGATNAVAGEDSDGDGFSNLQEYISGFNPTNRASCFKVNTFEMPSVTNGGFVVRWSAVTGRVYGIYWATNLLNSFQPLKTNIVWPQASYTDTVHNAEFRNFYKVKVQLAP